MFQGKGKNYRLGKSRRVQMKTKGKGWNTVFSAFFELNLLQRSGDRVVFLMVTFYNSLPSINVPHIKSFLYIGKTSPVEQT